MPEVQHQLAHARKAYQLLTAPGHGLSCIKTAATGTVHEATEQLAAWPVVWQLPGPPWLWPASDVDFVRGREQLQ